MRKPMHRPRSQEALQASLGRFAGKANVIARRMGTQLLATSALAANVMLTKTLTLLLLRMQTTAICVAPLRVDDRNILQTFLPKDGYFPIAGHSFCLDKVEAIASDITAKISYRGSSATIL